MNRHLFRRRFEAADRIASSGLDEAEQHELSSVIRGLYDASDAANRREDRRAYALVTGGILGLIASATGEAMLIQSEIHSHMASVGDVVGNVGLAAAAVFTGAVALRQMLPPDLWPNRHERDM